MGYLFAGFQVVGVDIKPQPHYPFEFHQADALDFPLDGFDVVHASPPCQAWSDLGKQHKGDYPELIKPVRAKLQAWGGPYVIENVDSAPLHNTITLCGTMFPPLRVLRHRLFESNLKLQAPDHPSHPHVFSVDKRNSQYGMLDEWKDFVTVTGGGNCSVKAARHAMGIDWMTKHELNDAIPPFYTWYIGKQIVEQYGQSWGPGSVVH